MVKGLKRYCFGVGSANPTFMSLKNPNSLLGFLGNGIGRVECYQYGINQFVLMEFSEDCNFEERMNHEILIPLKRIFKKDHGSRKISLGTTDHCRIVTTLEIKNDPFLLKEYIEIHEPDRIWPEILVNMDTMGIMDMEIYLHEYRAYLIMDAPPDFNLKKDGRRWAKLPKEQEWQNYVAKYQKVDSKSAAVDKWSLMERVL